MLGVACPLLAQSKHNEEHGNGDDGDDSDTATQHDDEFCRQTRASINGGLSQNRWTKGPDL